MIGGGIAFRYAKALFELGLEQNVNKTLLKDLGKFNSAYSYNSDLRMVL
jgi:F0F1-type ATP synthase delta subunit